MRERYRCAEIVYYHPKKAAFSAMLAKAMELLPPKWRPADDDAIYPAPWTPQSRPKKPQLAHFGDESLIQYIASADKDNKARGDDKRALAAATEMCNAITYRREYRLLYTLDFGTAGKTCGVTKFRDDLRDKPDGRQKREEELATLLRRDHVWDSDVIPPILIYCPNLRMQAKEVEARVESRAGYAMSLNLHDDSMVAEELRILNEKYKRLWRLYLFEHPRLCAGLDERLQQLIRSSLVDAFCQHYRIAASERSPGCRFEYVPFSARIDELFLAWSDDPIVKSWPKKEVLESVKTHAKSLGFWQDRFGSDTIYGYALTPNEYFNGFRHLALIGAADSATDNEKSQWPEDLREMQGQEWYSSVDSTKKETVRNKAKERFKTLVLAGMSENAVRDPVQMEDWEQVRTRVITELARIEDTSR
jgi:hypothetical protein